MTDTYEMENNYIEENNKEEEPLAILNLEIEKGVIKQIKLYKDSNPEEVSYAFCKDNNIDLSLMDHIKNEIESLMQKYFQSTKEQNINNNEFKENNYEKKNKNFISNNNNNNNTLNDEYNSYQNINQPKNNNMSNNNNNEVNNRKLFFYQFLQNKKLRKLYMNKAYSVNKYKMKVFNTINNTKKKLRTKQSFPEGKNLKYNNDSYLTQNYNTINNSKNSNIFERLYNDAKIKRVVYKRPCHYTNQSKEKNIFQDNISNIYETINGKTFNKNTLDMSPSYIRSYQIKPHQLLNKECSFQPNSFKYSRTNLNTNNNSYQLNSTHYSNNLPEYRYSNHKNNNNNFQDTIKSNDNSKKLINTNSNNYLYNNLNFEQNKNNILFEDSYKPLKNKIKRFSNVNNPQYSINSENMEMVSVEAFTNLFNLLNNSAQNNILNKNTLNINNIDNNTVIILSSIIQDINNNEIELNLENFIERIFKDISSEDKKFLIINYSNTSNNNSNYTIKDNRQQYTNIKRPSKNTYYGYNTSNNKRNTFSNKKFKTSTYFNSKKNYRLTSGTEKKKNFYYL